MHYRSFFCMLPFIFALSIAARDQIETDHFVVVFEQGNEHFAHEVVLVAEEVWDDLIAAYDLYRDYRKIHIYIADEGDYANGYALANKNTITVYTTHLNAGIRGTSNWIRNVVTHELAHVFSIKAADKNTPVDNFSLFALSSFRNPDWSASATIRNLLAPSWWIEGIAQYEAYKNGNDFWDTHRDMLLRMAVLENDLLNYVEMGTYGNRAGLHDEMTYNQGYSMVLFIDSVYGEQAVRKTAQATSWFAFDRTLQKSLGINGSQLFRNWSAHLKKKYEHVQRAVGEIREGRRLLDGGFWDHYACWSPDGQTVAMVSNAGYDVWYPHLHLMKHDGTSLRRLLRESNTVDSRISWFPDGQRLLYSRWAHNAPYLDLYVYNAETGDERPITWHARAMDPAVSPDGKTVAFIENRGGMQNLVLVDTDGRNTRKLTNFNDATQLYSPSWMPDGKRIVLGIFSGDDRDIAIVNATAAPFDRVRKLTDTLFFPDSTNFQESLDFQLLVHTTADERDPCVSSDGRFLYYSSDRTGIFNIYRMNLENWQVEQVTNVIGGAFLPDIDRAGTALVYTGFHAANYSVYTMKLNTWYPIVKLQYERRDYRTRKRDPYIFSAGAGDRTSRTGQYQYRSGAYKARFTAWDVSPYVSLEPAYVGERIGDSQLRGGLRLAFGELSGQTGIEGILYGGKQLSQSTALSWGGDLALDIALPRLLGENRDFRPAAKLYAGRHVLRESDELAPSAITPGRKPVYAEYISSTRGPDTVVAQYYDDLDGEFRSEQTFDNFGIFGTLQLGRFGELSAGYERSGITYNGDIYEARPLSRLRIYELDRNVLSDISGQLVASSAQLSDTGDTYSIFKYFDNFTSFKSGKIALNYTFSNVRPARIIPSRADIVSLGAQLIGSDFAIGNAPIGTDTTVIDETGESPDLIYFRDANGNPVARAKEILQHEEYMRFEAFLLERIPFFESKRHFLTMQAFLGALDRKLPASGNSYPLRYRMGTYMRAYPYTFDPVDTGTIRDSFPAVDVITGDTVHISLSGFGDTIIRDILWGNGIAYFNAEFTFELFRGLTIAPFGMLVRGLYVTPFAEAGWIWNLDLKDLSPGIFLGGKVDGVYRSVYLRDAGVRVDMPLVLFENWQGLLSFTWARRLSLDEKILWVNKADNMLEIGRLSKDRYSIAFSIAN